MSSTMFTSAGLVILLSVLSSALATVDLLGLIATPDPIRLPSVVPGESTAVSSAPIEPKVESFFDKLTAPLSAFQGSFPCLGQTSLRSGKCMSFNTCVVDGGFGDGKGLCLVGDMVCCVKPIKCGEISLLNNTILASPGFPGSTTQSGSCVVTLVKPIGISHIKLLIEDMELAQPDPITGKCDVDAFSVSGGVLPGFGLEKICGLNAKTHIYVPTVKDAANILINVDLSGELSIKRRWLIRAEMIEEKSPERPPQGCAQYFREETGLLTSLNFDLANKTGLGNIDGLKYGICLASKNDKCSVTFDPIFFNLGQVNSHAAPALGRLSRAVNTLRPYSPVRLYNQFLPYFYRPSASVYQPAKQHAYAYGKARPSYHRPSVYDIPLRPHSPFFFKLPANAIANYNGAVRPMSYYPNIYSGPYRPPMKKPGVDEDNLSNKVDDNKLVAVESILNLPQPQSGLVSAKVCLDQDILVFPVPDDNTGSIHCGNDLHFGSSLTSSNPPFIIMVNNKGLVHGKGFAVKYRIEC